MQLYIFFIFALFAQATTQFECVEQTQQQHPLPNPSTITVAFLLASGHHLSMEEAVETQVDYADRGSKGGKARMQGLSTEEKRDLAVSAAQARWGKTKKASKKKSAGRSASQPRKGKDSPEKRSNARAGRSTTPRVFGIALAAAEKRYADAIQERAYHVGMACALDAEIPGLVQTINALKNTQHPSLQAQSVIEVSTASPWPATPPSVLQAAPSVTAAHPRASRAQGGAISGIDLADETEDDKFLRESDLPGGEWH